MHQRFPTVLKLAFTPQHFKIRNQPKSMCCCGISQSIVFTEPPLQRSRRHGTLAPTLKVVINEDHDS